VLDSVGFGNLVPQFQNCFMGMVAFLEEGGAQGTQKGLQFHGIVNGLDALEGTQRENVQQQNQESTVAHLALVYLNMLYSPMISCCWESRA
jgi:hypothetical protein